MANNIISRLKVSLGLDNSKFKSGLKESEKQTKGFGKSITNMATQIGIAFGLREVLRFGKELINLAGEAEGVQRAFEHIGGAAIFDELKTATKGTVSDLSLMKKAVQANNFQLPLENLASLFEFATARAAETGESVDFLVNSIVLGIGRKSPLILDNLGISAVRLRKELKGVGTETATVADIAASVGRIAQDEMSKMGDTAATTGQKIQSFAATWGNLKVAIGQSVTESNLFKTALSEINVLFKGLGSTVEKTGAQNIFESWEKQGRTTPVFIKKQIKSIGDQVEELNKGKLQILEENKWADIQLRFLGMETSGDKLNKQIEDRLQLVDLLNKKYKEIEKSELSSDTPIEIRNIEALSKKISDLKINQQISTGSRLTSINKEIAALTNEINTLKKLGLEIDKNATKTGISGKQTGLYAKPVDQSVKLPPLELPTTLGTEGTLGGSEQLEALLISDKVAADQEIVRNQLMQTQTALSAYGSVMGSVGQITAAMGDSTIATFANVAAQVISSVAQMIPALFSQSIGGAVAAGSSLPFPANLAAIAAGVAGVVSAFSGIGGGSASAGSSVTSIDTRGFKSPMVDGSTRRTADAQTQNINVEVVGTIKGKDIALANNQGQKQLRR